MFLKGKNHAGNASTFQPKRLDVLPKTLRRFLKTPRRFLKSPNCFEKGRDELGVFRFSA